MRLINFTFPYFWGSFDAGYFAWVDFYQKMGIKSLPKTIKYYLATHKLGFIWRLNNYIVVSQKPNLIKKNKSGLHRETGPALTYDDNGLSDIYALNGIMMKKEYVMTPAEQLNPKDIIAESNVDVRRELIRKIGIERMLEQLNHTVIDKVGNYELLNVELSPELKNCRYLKMQNPSVGVWHLEGVEGDSVTEALNFRAKNIKFDGDWRPSQLT